MLLFSLIEQGTKLLFFTSIASGKVKICILSHFKKHFVNTQLFHSILQKSLAQGSIESDFHQ
jgi:hypothetical protein